MNDERTTLHHVLDGVDQLYEGWPFWTHRVGHAILALERLLKTEAREIVNVDPPDPVVASAANGEGGKMAQQPGDVVDQHAVATEQDGRTHHRVGHAGLDQRPFDERLATKIWQWRVRARVRDADVHDALNAGEARGVKERPGVSDRQFVIDSIVRKAHPVRVVQGGHAFERFDQANVVVEVQAPHFDFRTVGCPIGVARQGTDMATGVDEGTRNGLSGITESPGDDVETSVRRARRPFGSGEVSSHAVGGDVGVKALSAPSSTTSCWAWAK